MLITKVKPVDEILPLVSGRVIALCCEGCSEVHYPEKDVVAVLNKIMVSGTDNAIFELVYMCSQEHLDLYLQNNADLLNEFDTILVASCGVGVQALCGKVRNVSSATVISVCDTLKVPGFQGLTPFKFDCALCGECHLNETAAICPITSCAKSLLGGGCGGAKNGMCETDSAVECGWERIYKRLALYNPPTP
ncbi:MAG: methylenetetrahydrofolate reductase C-terminal domain-containing protein [Oscillospiraceae bacterium]|nr:methylenetetrahydrofolate reductase C-terminal domain-containing protein [Oscillospiraceae bacterium]